MRKYVNALVVIPLVLFMAAVVGASSDFPAPVTSKDRCQVCGMFVAKYQAWLVQVQLSDGRVLMFDGPKDMFVFLFSLAEYGAGDSEVMKIAVKDYYTQSWIDGKEAFYVTGSDIYGPMGNELVPFSQRQAAENFLRDHHGETIMAFAQVTEPVVQSMRKGHKMKMGD